MGRSSIIYIWQMSMEQREGRNPRNHPRESEKLQAGLAPYFRSCGPIWKQLSLA